MVVIGEPQQVADRYLELSFDREVGDVDARRQRSALGDGAARVSDVWLGTTPASEQRRCAQVAERAQGAGHVRPRRARTRALRSRSTTTNQPVMVAPRATRTSTAVRTGRASRWCSRSPSTTCSPPAATSRAHGRHRGTGVDVIDRYESGFSFVVTGSVRAAGSWMCRSRLFEVMLTRARPRRGRSPRERRRARCAEPATSRSGYAIRGPRALTDDWSPLLAPDVQHRPQRVQAEVLRLGARLRVAGDAAAAAVRRAVRVLHHDRLMSATAEGPGGRSTTARSCSARSCCSRSSPRRRAARSAACVDRENLVRKIQFPRLVIPLSVVLLALFNLALNLIVVFVFPLIAGVRPMLSWLELPLIVIDAGGVRHGHRDAAVRAVRALPRHPADLGSLQPGAVLRLAGDHPDRNGARSCPPDRCCTSTC